MGRPPLFLSLLLSLVWLGIAAAADWSSTISVTAPTAWTSAGPALVTVAVNGANGAFSATDGNYDTVGEFFTVKKGSSLDSSLDSLAVVVDGALGTLTFDASSITTPGKYYLVLQPGVLVDTNSDTNAATTTYELVLKIGFTPAFTVKVGASTVTTVDINNYLPGYASSDNLKVLVTASGGFVLSNAYSGVAPSAGPFTSFTGAGASITEYSFDTTSTSAVAFDGTSSGFYYPFAASTTVTAGSYSTTLQEGQICGGGASAGDPDEVCNVASSSLTLKRGLDATVTSSWTDGKWIDASTTTTVTITVSTPNKRVNTAVAPGTDGSQPLDALSEFFDITPNTVGTNLDSVTTINYAAASQTSTTFVVSLSGVALGKYIFQLKQGVLFSNSAPNFGEATATLRFKLGFEPSLKLYLGSATTDLAGTWLPGYTSGDGLKVVVKGAGSYSTNGFTGEAPSTAFAAFTGGSGGVNVVKYSFSGSSTVIDSTGDGLAYLLSASTSVTASIYTTKLNDGVVCKGSGDTEVCNFESGSLTVKRGLDASVTSSWTDGKWIDRSSVTTVTLTVTTGNADTDLATPLEAGVDGSSNAYDALSEFFAVTTPDSTATALDGVTAISVGATSTTTTFTVTLATIALGKYSFQLNSQVIESGSAPNFGEATATLRFKLGFEPSLKLYLGSATTDLAGTWLPGYTSGDGLKVVVKGAGSYSTNGFTGEAPSTAFAAFTGGSGTATKYSFSGSSTVIDSTGDGLAYLLSASTSVTASIYTTKLNDGVVCKGSGDTEVCNFESGSFSVKRALDAFVTSSWTDGKWIDRSSVTTVTLTVTSSNADTTLVAASGVAIVSDFFTVTTPSGVATTLDSNSVTTISVRATATTSTFVVTLATIDLGKYSFQLNSAVLKSGSDSAPNLAEDNAVLRFKLGFGVSLTAKVGGNNIASTWLGPLASSVLQIFIASGADLSSATRTYAAAADTFTISGAPTFSGAVSYAIDGTTPGVASPDPIAFNLAASTTVSAGKYTFAIKDAALCVGSLGAEVCNFADSTNTIEIWRGVDFSLSTSWSSGWVKPASGTSITISAAATNTDPAYTAALMSAGYKLSDIFTITHRSTVADDALDSATTISVDGSNSLKLNFEIATQSIPAGQYKFALKASKLKDGTGAHENVATASGNELLGFKLGFKAVLTGKISGTTTYHQWIGTTTSWVVVLTSTNIDLADSDFGSITVPNGNTAGLFTIAAPISVTTGLAFTSSAGTYSNSAKTFTFALGDTASVEPGQYTATLETAKICASASNSDDYVCNAVSDALDLWRGSEVVLKAKLGSGAEEASDATWWGSETLLKVAALPASNAYTGKSYFTASTVPTGADAFVVSAPGGLQTGSAYFVESGAYIDTNDKDLGVAWLLSSASGAGNTLAVKAGIHTFKLLNGQLCNSDITVCNAETSGDIKRGADLTFTLKDGSTVVSFNTWWGKTTTLKLKYHHSEVTFVSSAPLISATSAFSFTAPPGAGGSGNAFSLTGTPEGAGDSDGGAQYPIATTDGFKPGIHTVKFNRGFFCSSGNVVCNADSTQTFRRGSDLLFRAKLGSDDVTGDMLTWWKAETTLKLVIKPDPANSLGTFGASAPADSPVSVAGPVGATSPTLYSFVASSGTYLTGSTGSAADDGITYLLSDSTSVTEGTHHLSVNDGVFCDASSAAVCNAASGDTIRRGFAVSAALLRGTDEALAIPLTTWIDTTEFQYWLRISKLSTGNFKAYSPVPAGSIVFAVSAPTANKVTFTTDDGVFISGSSTAIKFKIDKTATTEFATHEAMLKDGELCNTEQNDLKSCNYKLPVPIRRGFHLEVQAVELGSTGTDMTTGYFGPSEVVRVRLKPEGTTLAFKTYSALTTNHDAIDPAIVNTNHWVGPVAIDATNKRFLDFELTIAAGTDAAKFMFKAKNGELLIANTVDSVVQEIGNVEALVDPDDGYFKVGFGLDFDLELGDVDLASDAWVDPNAPETVYVKMTYSAGGGKVYDSSTPSGSAVFDTAYAGTISGGAAVTFQITQSTRMSGTNIKFPLTRETGPAYGDHTITLKRNQLCNTENIPICNYQKDYTLRRGVPVTFAIKSPLSTVMTGKWLDPSNDVYLSITPDASLQSYSTWPDVTTDGTVFNSKAVNGVNWAYESQAVGEVVFKLDTSASYTAGKKTFTLVSGAFYTAATGGYGTAVTNGEFFVGFRPVLSVLGGGSGTPLIMDTSSTPPGTNTWISRLASNAVTAGFIYLRVALPGTATNGIHAQGVHTLSSSAPGCGTASGKIFNNGAMLLSGATCPAPTTATVTTDGNSVTTQYEYKISLTNTKVGQRKLTIAEGVVRALDSGSTDIAGNFEVSVDVWVGFDVVADDRYEETSPGSGTFTAKTVSDWMDITVENRVKLALVDTGLSIKQYGVNNGDALSDYPDGGNVFDTITAASTGTFTDITFATDPVELGPFAAAFTAKTDITYSIPASTNFVADLYTVQVNENSLVAIEPADGAEAGVVKSTFVYRVGFKLSVSYTFDSIFDGVIDPLATWVDPSRPLRFLIEDISGSGIRFKADYAEASGTTPPTWNSGATLIGSSTDALGATYESITLDGSSNKKVLVYRLTTTAATPAKPYTFTVNNGALIATNGARNAGPVEKTINIGFKPSLRIFADATYQTLPEILVANDNTDPTLHLWVSREAGNARTGGKVIVQTVVADVDSGFQAQGVTALSSSVNAIACGAATDSSKFFSGNSLPASIACDGNPSAVTSNSDRIGFQYKLSLINANTGAHSIAVENGVLTSADGSAKNFKVAVTLRVGFDLTVNFIEGSTRRTNDWLDPDKSLFVELKTRNAPFGNVVFSSDYPSTTSYPLPRGDSVSLTTFRTTGGALNTNDKIGQADATLPVSSTSIKYPLDTDDNSVAVAGTYTFSVTNGILLDGNGAGNVESTGTLHIGFKPVLWLKGGGTNSPVITDTTSSPPANYWVSRLTTDPITAGKVYFSYSVAGPSPSTGIKNRGVAKLDSTPAVCGTGNGKLFGSMQGDTTWSNIPVGLTCEPDANNNTAPAAPDVELSSGADALKYKYTINLNGVAAQVGARKFRIDQGAIRGLDANGAVVRNCDVQIEILLGWDADVTILQDTSASGAATYTDRTTNWLDQNRLIKVKLQPRDNTLLYNAYNSGLPAPGDVFDTTLPVVGSDVAFSSDANDWVLTADKVYSEYAVTPSIAFDSDTYTVKIKDGALLVNDPTDAGNSIITTAGVVERTFLYKVGFRPVIGLETRLDTGSAGATGGIIIWDTVGSTLSNPWLTRTLPADFFYRFFVKADSAQSGHVSHLKYNAAPGWDDAASSDLFYNSAVPKVVDSTAELASDRLVYDRSGSVDSSYVYRLSTASVALQETGVIVFTIKEGSVLSHVGSTGLVVGGNLEVTITFKFGWDLSSYTRRGEASGAPGWTSLPDTYWASPLKRMGIRIHPYRKDLTSPLHTIKKYGAAPADYPGSNALTAGTGNTVDSILIKNSGKTWDAVGDVDDATLTLANTDAVYEACYLEFEFTVARGTLARVYSFAVRDGTLLDNRNSGNVDTTLFWKIGFQVKSDYYRYDDSTAISAGEWMGHREGSYYILRVGAPDDQSQYGANYRFAAGPTWTTVFPAAEDTYSFAPVTGHVIPHELSISTFSWSHRYAFEAGPGGFTLGKRTLRIAQGLFCLHSSAGANVACNYDQDELKEFRVGFFADVKLCRENADGPDAARCYSTQDKTDVERVSGLPLFDTSFFLSNAHTYSIVMTYRASDAGVNGTTFDAYDAAALTTMASTGVSSIITMPASFTPTSHVATLSQDQTKLIITMKNVTGQHGIKDFMINSGTLRNNFDTTVMNSEVRFRFQFGLEPVFMNVAGTFQATKRQVDNTIVTNLNAVRVRMRGTATNVYRFNTVFSSVFSMDATNTNPVASVIPALEKYYELPPIQDKEYANINNGNPNSPYIDYVLGIKALPDGYYKLGRSPYEGWLRDVYADLEWINANVSLLIDRKDPVPKATELDLSTAAVSGSMKRYVGDTMNTGASSHIPLPTDLFTDATSNTAAQMSISCASIGDDKNIVLTGNRLNSAYFTSTGIRGPAGLVVFNCTGRDEAGNDAFVTIKIRVYTKATPVLTLYDARGPSGSIAGFVATSSSVSLPVLSPDPRTGTGTVDAGVFFTGGPASFNTIDSSVSFTASVVFTEKVVTSTVGASDLSVSVLSGSGFSTATATVTSFLASTDGVTFAWNIKVTNIAVPANGARLQIYLPKGSITGIVTSDSGAETVASDVLVVVIDRVAPVRAFAAVLSTTLASVSVPFSVNLTSLFTDNPYPVSNLYYYSSGASINLGLVMRPGTDSQARIIGVPELVPTARLDANGNTKAFIELYVIARDLAGNVAASSVSYQVAIKPAPGAKLDVPRDTIQFKEGDPAPLLFPYGSFQYATNGITQMADEVKVTITNIDASGSLEKPASPNGATVVAVDAVTRTASAKLTSTGNLSPLAITTWISTLTYANTNPVPMGGERTVQITITAGGDNSVVAYGETKVNVIPVNNLPVVACTTAPSTINWLESTGSPVVLCSGATVTDLDDPRVASARVRIATKPDSTPTYNGCDPERDLLALPFDYLGANSKPLLKGVWYKEMCELVITLIGEQDFTTFQTGPTGVQAATPNQFANAVTKADMAAALSAITYTNLDKKNPLNREDPTAYYRKRAIFISVRDLGSNGLFPVGSDSVEVNRPLTINAIDDPPVIDFKRLYDVADTNKGGWLSSSDTNANVITMTVNTDAFRHRRMSLRIPAPAQATANKKVKFTLNLDLRKTSSDVDGIFAAGGIIADPDDKDPPAVGSVNQPTIVYLDPLTSLTEVPLSSLPTYKTFVSADSVLTPLGFTYSTTGLSVFTFSVDETAAVGPLRFRLKYQPTSPTAQADFFVDVRAPGCTLPDADNFVALSSPSDQWASIILNYYPTNSLCTYGNSSTTIDLSVGGTLGRGAFNTTRNDLLTKKAALTKAGFDLVDLIEGLSEERVNARGKFMVDVPAGATSTLDNTLPLTAIPVDSKVESLLYLPPTLPPQSTADTSIAVKLGPACTTFVEPVKVCVFVGDTKPGFSRKLAIVSQVDCADFSKGYKLDDFESSSTLASTYDAVTGEVCAWTKHFSVALPLMVPSLPDLNVDRLKLGSGSCPKACSGRGFCAWPGKCECEPGFTGDDCSLRSCPVADSWDHALARSNDGAVGNVKSFVHAPAECSNRGHCDRFSGECDCFPGFTGAACQRTKCGGYVPDEYGFGFASTVDCSGHGRCVTGDVMQGPLASGKSGRNPISLDVQIDNSNQAELWAINRIASCLCDEGYTGADCSERTCPYGPDPEVVKTCNTDEDIESVQQVVLDFGSLPAGAAMPLQLYNTDEISLRLVSDSSNDISQKRFYSTPRVVGFWQGGVGPAQAMRNAIKSLPNLAVDDVQVSVEPPSFFSPAAVTFSVTFTGENVMGDVPLLQCPYYSLYRNADQSWVADHFAKGANFLRGCGQHGCRPKYKQMRIVDKPQQDGGVRMVDYLSVLQQPRELNLGDSQQSGRWGVISTITVKKTSLGLTYSVKTQIYEESTSTIAGRVAATVAETPVPPADLRGNVTLPYGLVVDFDKTSVNEGDHVFKWKIPYCHSSVKKTPVVSAKRVECSGRGLCDRKVGLCRCFEGYSGYRCTSDDEDVQR